jgi:hypothetical protein
MWIALPKLKPRVTKHGNPSLWPLESELAEALADAIGELGVNRGRADTGKRYIEHDWDPLPGGIDLYVTAEAGSELLIVAELKLEEIPQTMWDLYKAIAARKLPGAPSAFLVVGATGSAWATKPCAELFPEREGRTQEIDTIELFNSNRKQFAADLEYRGRMSTVPTSVRSSAVFVGTHEGSYSHLEFRISAVEPADASPIPCLDGWPLGVGPWHSPD